MDYEIDFLIALAVTLAVEGILLFLMARYVFRIEPKSLRSGRIIFFGILASSATLPYLWFIMPYMFSSFYMAVALGEGLVIAAEAAVYSFGMDISFKRSWIISLVCNAASVGAGLIMFFLIYPK